MMDRTSPAREYNKAVTQLIIIAFFGACGAAIIAFGIYGFNNFGFSEMFAVAFTGLGFILAITSGIPFVPAWEAYRRARSRSEPRPQPPPPPPRKPPPPPRNNASHEGRATGLENRRGNTVSLGYLRLHRRQWRALVEELKKHSEQNTIYWSRRKMENHNMPEIDGTDWEAFTGLTARNVRGDTKFKVLTQELQSLRIVSEDGKRVTNKGWRELCRVSGLQVTI